MAKTVQINTRRKRRPWPILLTQLRETGLDASYSPAARLITVVLENPTDEELMDAWRRRGAKSARSVMLPVITVAGALLASVFVWQQPNQESSQIGSRPTQPSRAINCQTTMLSDLARVAESMRVAQPEEFGAALSTRMPNSETVAQFEVLSELGGVSQTGFRLARADCDSFDIVATLTLEGDTWVKTKITRQPSG